MMVARALLVLLTAGAASCASGPSFDFEQLSFQPTPVSWDLPSVWAFVVVDKKGRMVGSMTLRFTDQPAETCIGGDWKKVEILRSSGDPKRKGGTAAFVPLGVAQPSYSLKGRALQIGLTANICDAYDEFTGELSERGFVGRFTSSGLFYHEEFGTVYGAEVE